MSTVTAGVHQHVTTGHSLFVQTCCKCAMVFAVPSDFEQRRRDDHQTFFCPAGHGQSYQGPSEAERLKRQLESEKRVAGWREEEIAKLKRDKESLKFKAMAERGHKVRLQKRIAAGVCPCCTRSFANLSAHMAHMHPEFTSKGDV